MEQWRTKVISNQKKKRRGSRLGRTIGKALYLGMLGGIVYLGLGVIESRLFPPGEEEVIEAVVIHDWFHKDLKGKSSLFNPLIDEGFRQLGLQVPGNFPPYVDNYVVTVLEDCTPYVIELPDLSFLGEESRYESLAEEIGLGDKVRITMVEDNGRYFGTSIELLGKSEIPERCPFFPSQDSRVGSVRDLESSKDWYLLQDAYLIDTMTAHNPSLTDRDGLAQHLYDRLSSVDDKYFTLNDHPDAKPTNIFLLDHAELIRLSLLFDYFDEPANRTGLGAMLDEDHEYKLGEHGGRVLWDPREGLEFKLILNPVLEYVESDNEIPPDAIYYFNHLDYRGMEVLAMFHFHAMYPEYNAGWPSPEDVAGAISSNTDGVMVSRQPDSTLNVTFYTNGGVMINLGPFDYAE